MKAIIKRELAAYFSAPIGFIYLGVMYFFAGFFFFSGVLLNNSTDMSPVFSSMVTLIMIMTPLLTMRLMSEDKRHKTDQTLLTVPVTLMAIVAGKFCAAALVYTAGILVTLAFAVVVNAFVTVEWAVIVGNFIALLLLGCAFISIGQFVSSLTENQAIAAIGGFAAMFIVFLLDAVPSIVQNSLVTTVINGISFTKRYTPITHGILDMADLFFFVSVCAIFLFLTTRVLEKRRWS
ncbi:MAG: ABC transporter permease subunit [Treponema sp.]|jgi:ABC-2 type transport system permease protein|nr:ABC transporter permease subunit [Treponema sp.]